MGWRENRRQAPWWAQVALLGSRTRAQVMSYFWLTVLLGPVSLGLGVWLLLESPVFAVPGLTFVFGAVTAVPAAASYWFAARWADHNDGWGNTRGNGEQ